MNAETKIATRRLACCSWPSGSGTSARHARNRTSFCEWRRPFRTHGLEGLKDLPPIHRSHPLATPEETVARILEIALERPARGCNRIEAALKLEGRRVSPPTIQKIPERHGLGTRHHRWLALELRPEHVAFIEKLNPAFRERHVDFGMPGGLLCADTVLVGNLKGIGKLCLRAVVGTYSSHAFGFPNPAPLRAARVRTSRAAAGPGAPTATGAWCHGRRRRQRAASAASPPAIRQTRRPGPGGTRASPPRRTFHTGATRNPVAAGAISC